MFRVERPRSGPAPVVVEIPHAGTGIPDDVARVTEVDETTRRRDADLYVDELYTGVTTLGATLVVAGLSRYVVDLNRDAADVDGRTVEGMTGRDMPYPRGVIWRETADGRRALRRKLTHAEYNDRIERFHRPYHDALTTVMSELHARFGRVLLLSGHSMPSTAKEIPGTRWIRRADVVPGTRGRTTASPRWIDAVETHFRAAGLSVRHDDPYRGGATTVRWGRPNEGYHAIQVELNRALYMNEDSLGRRGDRFTWVGSLCAGLVARCIDLTARNG